MLSDFNRQMIEFFRYQKALKLVIDLAKGVYIDNQENGECQFCAAKLTWPDMDELPGPYDVEPEHSKDCLITAARHVLQNLNEPMCQYEIQYKSNILTWKYCNNQSLTLETAEKFLSQQHINYQFIVDIILIREL